MKAISLWQPWASLIASGAKKIETRSWPTYYRGPLLIHAAKRKNKTEMRALADMPSYCGALGLHPINATTDEVVNKIESLPFGALICVADLIDCKSVDDLSEAQLHTYKDGYSEVWLGNYDPGRFGWILANPRPITPVPYKGEQGLFNVDTSSVNLYEWTEAR